MNERRKAPEVVGLLCGAGALPLHAAETLRERGSRVVAVGIKGEADAAIEQFADETHWTGIAKLGRWLKIFGNASADVVLMLGAIEKSRMFGDKKLLLPDWQTIKLWYGGLKGKQDHSILGAVADRFEEAGLPVGSVVDYCPELLVPPGCLTGNEPDESQWRDIRFAWPIAKQIAALQIGQCIVVKEEAVVAVEGIEGTDAALRRGGRLAGEDAVAVKLAKEGHDERFDIPCIGPQTVDTLDEAGIAVLAVEADKTIGLDLEEVRDKGDRCGVSIVAVSDAEMTGEDT